MPVVAGFQTLTVRMSGKFSKSGTALKAEPEGNEVTVGGVPCEAPRMLRFRD